MNTGSKIVLLTGVAVLILMALYPPWVRYELRWIQRPNSNAFEGTVYNHRVGYAFITTPPSDPPTTYLGTAFIDLTRLVIHWVVVAAITGGVLVLWSRKEPGLTPSGPPVGRVPGAHAEPVAAPDPAA
jgi:hypothetical protein